ncbi:MAG: hypothetical protein HC927_08410, partial [Deltaproteobacteria bacterium]|nr:hypothetical protein [Deltaproteobacteria bacterium]
DGEPVPDTCTVLHTSTREADTIVLLTYALETGEHETIRVTRDHPIWAADLGVYRRADRLQPGAALLLVDGHRAKVEGAIWQHGRFTVHNLEVEQAHNYYASGGSLTGAFLVHNGGSCAILARLRTNFSVGQAFEKAALSRLGLLKNTTTIEGFTRGGHLGRAIPDAITDAGVYEFKNRLFISHTRQLQIQINYAISSGKPFNLVVSPRTQYVSAPLKEAIKDTGGTVMVFDSSTGVLSPFLH